MTAVIEAVETQGERAKREYKQAQETIFTSNNTLVKRLLTLDRQIYAGGLPFAELLTRLAVVTSPKAQNSLLKAVEERLLLGEFLARENIALCEELRAAGLLPAPLEHLPDEDRSLAVAHDI